ncbi:C40 family peptidase [Catenuloplanes japonicus]|uniref:C40 family peptidase n=1 Tax=Catenuloplanes japonicus TaxID=33876 RepID=UPI000690E298|nr:C40 family peptidase [Catenuloplanes japonicus]
MRVRIAVTLLTATAVGMPALLAPDQAATAAAQDQHRTRIPAAVELSPAPNLGATGSKLGAGLPVQREALTARAELAAMSEAVERQERAVRASRGSSERRAEKRAESTPAKGKNAPKKRGRPASSKPRRPRSSHPAVDFALAQVGKPYIENGVGPGGYDCSGLTMAAWAQAGVRLPHYTGAQAQRGRGVSRSQAEPGAIVVLPGHVGLYLGDGLMVHAPYPGARVEVSPIWGSPRFRQVG